MKILNTINGHKSAKPPVWIMRQAGRYLPEYRQLRQEAEDFIAFCLDPDKASEATLQPIKRFGFDAAIIFSDILLIPWAMKRGVKFITGTGPVLNPLTDISEITGKRVDIANLCQPVAKAIAKTKSRLPKETALIGFAGAPWTLMTYMIEGGSSRDFMASKTWLWTHPKHSHTCLEILSEYIVDFLKLQAEAGADILMLFDSWAGAVPASLREDIIFKYHNKIITALRRAGVTQPIIAFPKGLGEGLIAYSDKVDVQVLALDHHTDVVWAAKTLRSDLILQGNLDPLCLVAGGDSLKIEIENILNAFLDRPHIFNLGHGIVPQTPLAHVEQLLSWVR